MSYPIELKFRRNGEIIENPNFSYVYLYETLGFLFSDDYIRGTLKSDAFLFSLMDKEEVWCSVDELEYFLTEFKDFIVKSGLFDKQIVINKETDNQIDWFVTDVAPILKPKSILSLFKLNAEYRTLRLTDDFTFCIHDGVKNLYFNFETLNQNDIFEAVRITIDGKAEYQKGNKIQMIKKEVPGLAHFKYDFIELDDIKAFMETNKCEFAFIDPEE